MQAQPFSEQMIVEYLDLCEYQAERPSKGSYVVSFEREELSEVLGPRLLLNISKQKTIFQIKMTVELLQWHPIMITQLCNDWNLTSNAPVTASWYMPVPDIEGFKRHMESMSDEERESFDLSHYPVEPLQSFAETRFTIDLEVGIYQNLFNSMVTQCINASFYFFRWLEKQDPGLGEAEDDELEEDEE